MTFKMHKTTFFSRKKYVCLPYLQFSDPLPESRFFYLTIDSSSQAHSCYGFNCYSVCKPRRLWRDCADGLNCISAETGNDFFTGENEIFQKGMPHKL